MKLSTVIDSVMCTMSAKSTPECSNRRNNCIRQKLFSCHVFISVIFCVMFLATISIAQESSDDSAIGADKRSRSFAFAKRRAFAFAKRGGEFGGDGFGGRGFAFAKRSVPNADEDFSNADKRFDYGFGGNRFAFAKRASPSRFAKRMTEGGFGGRSFAFA